MRGALLISLLSLGFLGCGPGGRNNGDDGGGSGSGNPDAPTPQCNDGAVQCLASTLQTCSGGQWMTTQDCPAACDATLGCVECLPNQPTCTATGDVATCDATGHVGGVTTTCTGTMLCDQGSGTCVDACANAAANRSYTGCEYWAVDLDNALEIDGAPTNNSCSQIGPQDVLKTIKACFSSDKKQTAGLCDPPNDACPTITDIFGDKTVYTCQTAPACLLDAEHATFAVVVSNSNPRPVDVTMAGGGGQTFTTTVAAGAVVPLLPTMNGIPDQSIDGTGKTKQAYEITSTLPIVAYQFNPLDNSANVFSNDASLLIPRTAFDIDYYGMTWESETLRPDGSNFNGYITVVAWTDNTMVEVTPTVAVEASASQTTIAANTPTTFTLNAFEVLNLEAKAPGDLTGTKIHSVDGTTTFGVFAGHEAMGFGGTTPPDSTHTSGPCCGDHIEEMMFPTSTWGKTFAIAKSSQRSNENDLIRVMVQKPNTTVTFDPAPVSGTCNLASKPAGSFCQVEIKGDTTIIASEPVLVGHYLESAIWQDNPFFGTPTSVGSGDPSLAIAVPIEQYRTDYTILAPIAYDKNWLSITAPAGGSVSVDGSVQTLTAFGTGGYRAARVAIQPGQHKISCPGSCGLEVYGYSDAVSYMFAGGLNLQQIVIN